ncbi:hypothetical protein HDU67_002328, partial [Dinochytrium kinnereticum]
MLNDLMVGVVVFRDDDEQDGGEEGGRRGVTDIVGGRVGDAVPGLIRPVVYLNARTVVEAKSVVKDKEVLAALVRPETPPAPTPTPTPRTPVPMIGEGRPTSPGLRGTPPPPIVIPKMVGGGGVPPPSRVVIPRVFEPLDRLKRYVLAPTQRRRGCGDHLDLVVEVSPAHRVSVPVLTRAVKAVVLRHDVLRMRGVDGKMVVDEDCGRVEVRRWVKGVRVGRVEDGECGSVVAEIVNGDSAKEGHGVRVWGVEVVEGGDGVGLGVLVMRFLDGIMDAWSCHLVLEDLRMAYGRLMRNETAFERDVDVAFVDFAEWHCGVLKGGLLERQVGFWRGRVAGVQGGRIPVDRESGEGKVGVLRFDVDRYLAAKVREFSRKFRCTVHQTYTAALHALIHLHSSTPTPILTGQSTTLRRTPSLQKTVGPMTNIVLIRSDMDTTTTLQNLVAGIRKSVLAAVDNADVPFDDIVREVGGVSVQVLLEAVPSLSPTMTGGEAGVEFKGILPGPDPIPKPPLTPPFDLIISIEDTPGDAPATAAGGHVRFRGDRFDRETVWGIVGGFLRVLEALVEVSEGGVLVGEVLKGVAATIGKVGRGIERVVEVVGAVVREVLGVDVGFDGDFFDAGGNSLLAVQLSQRLSSHFNVPIPLDVLLDVPTIPAMTRQIESILSGATDSHSTVNALIQDTPKRPNPSLSLQSPSLPSPPHSRKPSSSPLQTPRSSTTLINPTTPIVKTPRRTRTLSFESSSSAPQQPDDG